MSKEKSISRKSPKKKRKPARARAARRVRRSVYARGRNVRSNLHARPRTAIGLQENGLGLEDDGESPDIKRLATMERANSETVEALAEEGQPFEAEVLAGVEEAENSDQTEVTTHEVLADDVPPEYDPER
jgi:hypothetical protein